MNKSLQIVLILICAAFIGCDKDKSINPHNSNIEKEIAEMDKVNSNNSNPVVSSPPPNLKQESKKEEVTPLTPPVVKEVIKEEKPKLAPDGIYFLRVSKSIESNDSLIGLKPGTKLTLVNNNTYVTDNGDKIELTPFEVTNVIDEIVQIISNERLNQSIIKQKLATPPPVAPPVVNSTPTPQITIKPNNPAVSNLNSASSRVKDGWYWKKNNKGEWVKDRPTRQSKD